MFETLAEALKDVHVAIGTTSGHQRVHEPESLPNFSPAIINTACANQIAFVLGNERDGLSKAELDRCHQVVKIPTNPEFSSLNVAQTAGIIAYELTRTPSTEFGDHQTVFDKVSNGEDDDLLFALIGELLEAAEFTRNYNRVLILSELRQFYQRALPTQREADLLKGALHKINQKLRLT